MAGPHELPGQHKPAARGLLRDPGGGDPLAARRRVHRLRQRLEGQKAHPPGGGARGLVPRLRRGVRPGFLPVPGLLPGQPKVIDFLLMVESAYQKEIADACLMEPATLCLILEKMEYTLVYTFQNQPTFA